MVINPDGSPSNWTRETLNIKAQQISSLLIGSDFTDQADYNVTKMQIERGVKQVMLECFKEAAKVAESYGYYSHTTAVLKALISELENGE